MSGNRLGRVALGSLLLAATLAALWGFYAVQRPENLLMFLQGFSLC